MNAGGISVPIFTTYSENDYEYILNDCKAFFNYCFKSKSI